MKNGAVVLVGLMAIAGCATDQQQAQRVYIPDPYDPVYTANASDADVCVNMAVLDETSRNKPVWVDAFLDRKLDRQKCGPHHDQNVDLKRRYISAINRQIAAAKDRQATIQRTNEARANSSNDVGGALFTALAAYAIAKDGRRGISPMPAQQRQQVGILPIDVDWQWDEFYGPNGQLVWACRGVQTGQFAFEDKCANRAKVDIFWPDKRAPF